MLGATSARGVHTTVEGADRTPSTAPTRPRRAVQSTEDHGLESGEPYQRSGARRFPVGAAWPAADEAFGGTRGAARVLPLPAWGVVAVGLGLVLRLVAALRLTPHVDEAASLLAAAMVVERGL